MPSQYCRLLLLALASTVLLVQGCGSSGSNAAAPAERPTAALEALRDAVAAGNGPAACRRVTAAFWRAFVSTDRLDSCQAVAADQLNQSGKLKQQVAEAEITSVKTEGDTSVIRFRAGFNQAEVAGYSDGRLPWSVTMQRQGDRWYLDKVCAIPARGQEGICVGRTE